MFVCCADVAIVLFSACQSGNASKIQELMEKEPVVLSLLDANHSNARNIAEKTIYTAALRGHYDCVCLLLQAGVDPNTQTSQGTPIYAAVKGGNFELLRYLVRHGADFKSPRGGFSPLYVACIEGRIRILRYLVSIGADIFSFNNPPLVFTACTAGQLEVVCYLMDQMNWDINRSMNGAKTDGKDTLLYTACSRNKLEIAGYLVMHGARITPTIISHFPRIIKHILQQRLRPVGSATPAAQMYIARLKEIGLTELPWPVMADYASRVTKLDLRGNSLAALPPDIFQMQALTMLDVGQNQLVVLASEDVKWSCKRCVVCTCVHGRVCMHVGVCVGVCVHACVCVVGVCGGCVWWVCVVGVCGV